MRLRRSLKRLLKSILFLICAASLLVIYMRYIEPRWLEVTHFEMTSGGQELRIAAFGDTHIGMGNDAPELEKLVREINDRRPDVVVFLGDLFDDLSTYRGDAEQCMEILSGIEAEYKYAVRGNHDVGGGAEWVYPDLIASAGFTLLENDSAGLRCGINLIGAADSTYFTADRQVCHRRLRHTAFPRARPRCRHARGRAAAFGTFPRRPGPHTICHGQDIARWGKKVLPRGV